MGVLVQLNGTSLTRFALLPVVLWTAWSTTRSLNPWKGDGTQLHVNYSIASAIVMFTGRAISWVFVREPFQRFPLPEKNRASDRTESHISMDVSEPDGTNIRKALRDACDLVLNIRGIGWSWSRIPYARYGAHQSRAKFLLKALASIACNALAADVAVEIVHAIIPAATGRVTILDVNLPLPQRLLYASIISGVYTSVVYFLVELSYNALAICFVIALGHVPAQWPPVFDKPWKSTSLGEFWGKRWHQLLRDYVISLGSRPFTACLAMSTPASTNVAAMDRSQSSKRGPLFVLGAFFVSGIFHDISFRTLGRGGKPIQMIGFFVMQGVGVILERAFFKSSLCGQLKSPAYKALGHIWVILWLLMWGIPYVDVCAQTGILEVRLFPEPLKPLRIIHVVWDMIATNLINFSSASGLSQ
ncbi:hypothetical protein J3A83DRAFT_4213590 [Scleroderma citrinum]